MATNKGLNNYVHVEGYFYDVGSGNNALTMKTVERKDSPNFGMNFFNGELLIATDEACTNIVSIHYTYEPEFRVNKETKEKTANKNFAAIKKLLDENKSVIAVGKDEATKLSINTSMTENAWYSAQNNEVRSTARLEGGWITTNVLLNPDENERAVFEINAFLNTDAVKHVQHDDGDDTLRLHCGVFNFRNDISIVDFVGGSAQVDFFEDIVSDGPVFACLIGVLDFKNIELTKTEEGAFGPVVRKISHKKKDYVITNVINYDRHLEDGNPLNSENITKAIQDREVRLAAVKTNYEDYQANKAASGTIFDTAPAASTTGKKEIEFKF